MAGQHIAGGIYGKNTPGRTLQGFPGGLEVYELLDRRLGQDGTCRKRQHAKGTEDFSHKTKVHFFLN